jgi:hypothetical protein
MAASLALSVDREFAVSWWLRVEFCTKAVKIEPEGTKMKNLH